MSDPTRCIFWSWTRTRARAAARVLPQGTAAAGRPPRRRQPPVGRGRRRLRAFVEDALRVAEDKGVEDVIAFATSAVRDAVNGEEVLAAIRAGSGMGIRVLSGEDEARLTFLAARRWFGWSSGRLLVLDIGGGSLEIASGADEEPDFAVSLPLGAGRLTRDWFTRDPPPPRRYGGCASTSVR